MQYLKEEIKAKIMNSALNEFYEKGFEKASMKCISHKAGVAIGNIYRYFKNKEELFNEIVEPVYNEFSPLVFNKFLPSSPSAKIQFNSLDIVNSVMKIYLDHSKELMIMMYKSEGTKYNNTKNDLINLVHKRLKLENMITLERQGIENCEMFIHIFAATLVEGLFMVLISDATIESKRKLIYQLLIFNFNKLDERFV